MKKQQFELTEMTLEMPEIESEQRHEEDQNCEDFLHFEQAEQSNGGLRADYEM